MSYPNDNPGSGKRRMLRPAPRRYRIRRGMLYFGWWMEVYVGDEPDSGWIDWITAEWFLFRRNAEREMERRELIYTRLSMPEDQ